MGRVIRSKSIIQEPQASVVADVLLTVAELRKASETALNARELFKGNAAPGIEAIDRAERFVRELSERVQSRARSAGIEENDLLAAAYDVLDGRRFLPAGSELQAAA